MKNFITAVLSLAACVAIAEPAKTTVDPVAPNIPGFVPVTINPGTNTVSDLPFTANMLPFVRDFRKAKPGDTLVWKGEAHTFDGKTWSGKDGDKALVPIHETFTVIRTAKVTDVWNIGGEVDVQKAMKQKQQKK